MAIEDALRLNASAVTLSIFVGAEGERTTLLNLAKLVDAGQRYGIPVLAVTAVGKDMVRDARYLGLACRIAAEHGAHFVKTYYCEGFEEVVRATPVPLVIAGGKKLPEREAIELAWKAIQAGAARRGHGPQHLPVGLPGRDDPRRARGRARQAPASTRPTRSTQDKETASRAGRRLLQQSATFASRSVRAPRRAPASCWCASRRAGSAARTSWSGTGAARRRWCWATRSPGVVEAGAGRDAFEPGDRVVATHHVPCNTCRYCLTRAVTACATRCTARSFDPGGFAELRSPAGAPRRSRRRSLLPDSVSYEAGDVRRAPGLRRPRSAPRWRRPGDQRRRARQRGLRACCTSSSRARPRRGADLRHRRAPSRGLRRRARGRRWCFLAGARISWSGARGQRRPARRSRAGLHRRPAPAMEQATRLSTTSASASRAPTETASACPRRRSIGDLDGDGKLEIVVSTFDHGIDVYRVPRSGTKRLPWPTGREPAAQRRGVGSGNETASAPIHRGDRPPEGPGGRRRVEHARPGAGGGRLHRGLAVAQPARVPHRPSRDRRVPASQVGTASSTTRCARTCGRSRTTGSPCASSTRAATRPGSGGRSYGNEQWEFDARETCSGARRASTMWRFPRRTAGSSGRGRSPSAAHRCRWHEHDPALPGRRARARSSRSSTPPPRPIAA